MTMPQETIDVLDEIRTAAAKLNKDMQRVNDTITEYEHHLADAGVGVTCAMQVDGHVESLCYGKIHDGDTKKWRLFVTAPNNKVTALLNASREIRIAMLEHIPKLLIAIKEELHRKLIQAGLEG